MNHIASRPSFDRVRNLFRLPPRRCSPPSVGRGFWTRALASAVVLLTAAGSSRGAEDTKLDFNRDVRPILSDNCFACHGPDSASREADLRLDERDAAIEMGAIVPESTEESEMIRRILSSDEFEVMPPPESKKTLSKEEKQILVRWVEQGAAYQKHWSFLTPKSPPLPEVTNLAWCRNPIDRFILARLEREGLTPSPEAERETLIRRVSYDLTGLPPSLVELDRFTTIADDSWYEQMVDYYLAKPAFGERMALAWMDAARYGDTSVFHADGPRDMWPWRDWVINAYNGNLPFDQFTIEQLAGDLLPNATPYQKIASGFNRNHATTDEGGAIAEEWRVDYVVDRVKTTSNVWLGISMECSQCHEHKFDPISQKEYYGFFAFFNQTTDPGMQTRNGNQAPLVNVPDPERDAKTARLQENVAKLAEDLKQHSEDAEPDFQKWLVKAGEAARSSEAASGPSSADLVAHYPLDDREGNQASDVGPSGKPGTVHGKAAWTEGKHEGGFQLDGGNYVEIPEIGDFEQAEQFSYGCWAKPDGSNNGALVAKMDEGMQHRGWDLLVSGGQVSVHFIHAWPENAIKVTTKSKLKPNEWTHVFATYDGSKKAAGITVYFNGEPQKVDVNQDSLDGTTLSQVPVKIGRRHTTAGFRGVIDDVRIYGRKLSKAEVAQIAGSDPIAPLLALESEKRSDEQVQTLRTHYLGTIDKKYQELTKQRGKLEADVATLKKQTVTSMVMGEQEKPRDTYLLMRGHYASPDKSEVIKPHVPKIFPPLPEAAPTNRLGLAQWLVSPEHPLTSRVTVNRYWTMLFGQGIVSTTMDFGTQGAWPTHPELLDWLAVDFRTNGWNIKRTLKQILMSSTYRQSSRRTAELAERDPQNLLLARGPRFRLQGEFIRDTALATSGLLSEQVGGPGTKPYQPAGLWNEVSLSGNVRFVQDKGEKLYRKSMYIYWKRSAPHPGMRIFDAPTREKCVIDRPRTNTPLQALYTMNDPQFVESARHLAQRVLLEGGETDEQRVEFAYRLVTSRRPSEQARAALLGLYESELQKYSQDSEATQKLLEVGETKPEPSLEAPQLAAWTIVANVILNLDVSLTKY